MTIEKLTLNQLESGKFTLVELEQFERQATFTRFDKDVAFELGLYVRRAAKAQYPNKPIVIDISLPNGHCLFRTTVGSGTVLDNDHWIERKHSTAMRFGRSSFYMGSKKGDLTPEEKYFVSAEKYAFHGGAVPIFVETVGYPIACLTVSGLKQHEDHFLAVNSLNKFSRDTIAKDLD